LKRQEKQGKRRIKKVTLLLEMLPLLPYQTQCAHTNYRIQSVH